MTTHEVLFHTNAHVFTYRLELFYSVYSLWLCFVSHSDRQTGRQTDRQRQRQTDREGVTGRQTGNRQTDRQTGRDRGRDRHRDRKRERETEKERDRDRQRQRQRQTETERGRDSACIILRSSGLITRARLRCLCAGQAVSSLTCIKPLTQQTRPVIQEEVVEA